MNHFFATEAMEKRASGFMPRGELTPEQQAELEQAKQRWFPGPTSPSSPVTGAVSSPARRALMAALGGGALGGLGGMAVGGPVGAAIAAPIGALVGGFGGHRSATDTNEMVEEAMRRGAQNQFDVDTLPQAAAGRVTDAMALQGLASGLR